MSAGFTSPMGFCSEDGSSITNRFVRLPGDHGTAEFAVFRPLHRLRGLTFDLSSRHSAIPWQVALPQSLLPFRRICPKLVYLSERPMPCKTHFKRSLPGMLASGRTLRPWRTSAILLRPTCARQQRSLFVWSIVLWIGKVMRWMQEELAIRLKRTAFRINFFIVPSSS